MIANGNVSNSGAFEEMSPSRLRPRGAKNEPVLSPTKHANPRKVPKTKVHRWRHRCRTSVFSADERMREHGGSVVKHRGCVPRGDGRGQQHAQQPEVRDPPMRPFHVFPSPSIRWPSAITRPPSMGRGRSRFWATICPTSWQTCSQEIREGTTTRSTSKGRENPWYHVVPFRCLGR